MKIFRIVALAAIIAAAAILIASCSTSITEPTADSLRVRSVGNGPTFVAGVSFFAGAPSHQQTSTFVQVTQSSDSTVVWTQVTQYNFSADFSSYTLTTLQDQTVRVPQSAFSAGRGTQTWTLTTSTFNVAWQNSGDWQRQTTKVVSQPPDTAVASGSIGGVPIPSDALGFLIVISPTN
jgi:hypothetical protein